MKFEKDDENELSVLPNAEEPRLEILGTTVPKAGKSITDAVAQTVRVTDPNAMRRLLRKTGKKSNRVIVLGFVPGTEPQRADHVGVSFKIVSKKIMAAGLGVDPGTDEGLDAVLGWHEIDGERCICRLKTNMVPSSWCLLDIDAVRGMPDPQRQCHDPAPRNCNPQILRPMDWWV